MAAAVHFATEQYLANLTQPTGIRNESQIFTIFLPVQRALCSLGLKINFFLAVHCYEH